MSHTDPQQPSPGDSSGSSAYPSARYDPGPGWPSDPAPAGPSRSAVAALVVGILAILLCLFPFVNAVSVVGGIAAVVLGVVALRNRAAGAPGKGFAVAGITLGAVAAVVALAIWGLLVFAIAGVEGEGIQFGELEPVEESVEGAPAARTAVAPR